MNVLYILKNPKLNLKIYIELKQYYNMVKSQTQTIIDLSDLKMAKSAYTDFQNGIFSVIHYGTTILSHDFNKSITEINFNCSRTSDQQIYRALAILEIELKNCINVHSGKKYNESGANE